MHAEVISIGDELTSGQRLDTNSQWLSQRLGELGVRVLYHTTVADDLDANVLVFRQAIDRADLVIATGGLGPTADDLTREALAQAIGVPLELDEAQLERIRALFARRGRKMPQQNRVQAMFPAGSRPIVNPHGTAPGIALTIARVEREPCRVFALPGVPAEMFQMWEQSVAPAIRELTGAGRVIRHFRIKCFGVGESELEAKLPDLIRRGRIPAVGITVHDATITLRITAEGASPDECLRIAQPTIDTIHEHLGALAFGTEDDELQHAVARLLAERNRTLATAEWGAGGLIARWLGELEQARGRFLGGIVVASADSAVRSLNVPKSLIAQHGSCSPEVAGAMASACRAMFAADFALAVSDFPDLSVETDSPPRFAIALASAEGVITRRPTFAGHPDFIKARAAKLALDLARLTLAGN